ncbi:FadR/GntR family transcriptional regulator [Planctomonas psychrotolerans]|uniref:FadR/GntR family transcriptional regulator n=1 Tax=Planctomonas psychrotolerans TaxID=2528712 RepID=UPI001D0D0491|nr:GntR family transcriptional regulator [Planctomonas psychrotolerans]
MPSPGAPSAAAGETLALADEALFRPVRAGNAFEETVARLLQTIRLGIVAPGDALPAERDLAVRFAVSRDTVRDALKSLADAGFVVSRRGRYGGTFVQSTLPPRGVANAVEDPTGVGEVTAAEIEDILILRDALETGAARAAAGRSLPASERDALWRRLRDAESAPAGDYRRLDSRLHLTIAESAGAPSLVPLLAENRMRVNALLDAIPLLEPNIVHSNEQHERVVLAILTGNVDAAADAMREHLEGSAALLRGFLA